MSNPTLTASVKLVTIIAPYENAGSLGSELKALGVVGYTSAKCDGHGLHGPRRYGLLDGANVRIDVLAPSELAQKILDHIASQHGDEAMLALAADVVAVPRHRFA